jgi:hypothetical protein
MNKTKITLLLSGQLERNLITNDFLEIIEFQKKIFKFDNVICHLWNEEFEKVKHLKIPEYITILHDEDFMPFNDKHSLFISEEEHIFHAESILISQKQTDTHKTSDMMPAAFSSLKQLYAISKITDYALDNSDSDIFIRSRYDNNYIFSPNYLEINQYLNSIKPIIFVPRSHINYSLPDICYIMNKSGLESFKDYFNTCRNYSYNERVFWPENCLRFHANNAKKIICYRFNFPCYNHRWFKNVGHYTCLNIAFSKITRDVKSFKASGIRSADYIL